MSTSRCLYTYAQLNSNKPPDDLSATREHIVPYALGGSDGFSIPYCAKKANNDFGRDIDAPFIALPIVGFKRHALGLKSYAGIVPEIRAKGDCVELGAACDVVFPYDAPPYADFGISVAGGIDAGKISFTGRPDRLKDAIQSLIKKADRKGLQLLSEQLQPITTFENAIEAGHSTTGETLHFQLNLGHDEFFVPWTKGPNGVALSADGKVIFIAVTRGNQVWRAPLLADGSVSKVGAFRTFFGVSGPDGLALDINGGLVVAHASLGGAFVLNARGEVTHFVRSPKGATVTNIAFRPGENELVMTESATGSVLVATLPAGGQALYSHKSSSVASHA